MAVFGNLIPAVSAMVMGIILVVNYFFDGEEEKKIIKTLKDLSEKYGNILGIAGIIIGLIHFIIPTALFL
jgi:purine-cytosine permease-like protein